ncbi:MAG: phosphoglucosamine mutase [Arenimonas sp.]|nr:phosphoglucosamine mutase [Arenimonas sp.]MBP7981610.1 phosphoglucosamine mutase [Arenimonas sp.]
MSARKYFGTDGIRGRVGEGNISPDFILKLGWAAGKVLSQGRDTKPLVVIGKDTRISGYMFESALEAGFVAAGVDVRMLGPVPTPAVAHLTRSLRADAGIVISASHNPHYDNGIKFFSAEGEKISDAMELAIEAMLEQPLTVVSSERLGKVKRIDEAHSRYAELCKNTVPESFSLRGLKIALDCAHGATYALAPEVFSELGAEVVSIGVNPDGLNINKDVGSTHPEALQVFVKSENADLGIAFDGDGDRVQFVDSDGVLHDGDALIFILADYWKSSGRLKGPVVGTLMSNYALELHCQQNGMPFLRTNVGDRYVHKALTEHGGNLGGEASGHLLVLDRTSTGDAIVAALQVLEALTSRKLSLQQALAAYTPFPQKTVNVRLQPGAKPLADPAVQSAKADAEQSLEGRGRLVLRASGTEPVVRVTVEANDAALMEQVLGALSEAVKAAV